jgi:hypothetical protein
MSVHAGSILHVGGSHIIERIQSAGLGDTRNPFDVIREVGNRDVVDKVPTDPDFTFTMESLDMSPDIEALLVGKTAAGAAGGQGPSSADADGTVYDFRDCKTLNIASPWKDPTSGTAGNIEAGHVIPGYYVQRIRYRMGVTDNASQEVELGGGAFYYGQGAPVEQVEAGDGVVVAFPTDDAAMSYREGGSGGTTFRRILGVTVNGEQQTRGIDYTESAATAAPGIATVTFATAPGVGAVIKIAYLTTVAKSHPDTEHTDPVIKPAAVKGRNIGVYVGSGGGRVRVGGVQGFELEARIDGDLEREFDNTEVVGRTINGTDVDGTLTVRAKNAAAFFNLLRKVTNLASGELIGNLNQFALPLEIVIRNPKNPAQVLKTLYVPDALFSPPPTPARVNTPTDFAIQWSSREGYYLAYKGAKP